MPRFVIAVTSADIVVIFDSDWNPQNDLQVSRKSTRYALTFFLDVCVTNNLSMNLLLISQLDHLGDGQSPQNWYVFCCLSADMMQTKFLL